MLKTLFVVDDESINTQAFVTITFSDYFRDYPKLGEPKTRVINLCDTDRYLSQGYYCSLLAEARNHLVLPSVRTINGMRDGGAVLWFDNHKSKPDNLPKNESILFVCMGEAVGGQYQKIAEKAYQAFPVPLLQLKLLPEAKGVKVLASRVSLKQLDQNTHRACMDILANSAKSKWRNKKEDKQYRWDLAILYDPQEKVPPSNKGALDRFVKAGTKLGIRVHLVQEADLVHINQYDALFIRETTAINHRTYSLAHRAEKKGLVVIDDTNSILRCCNKVYLHDAFNYKKVPSLKTEFISDAEEVTLDKVAMEFGFPLVLKMPEGSFSKGVFKVGSRQELKSRLKELLKESALVLAQEYLYTDFDWRIGVLNGRAIYACRYYMARNHWQIYNHGSSRNFSGGFDALPTFEVPRSVLQAAIKAAAVVGNGLYGIDIKEANGNTYVLEVNDNPSIDHNVEDAYLGDELYMQIMAEFLQRLEQRGQ